MRIARGFISPVLVLLFWTGACPAEDTPRLAFAQVQVNDRSASLLFSTSLEFTCLLNTGASRLGLKNHEPWVAISQLSISTSDLTPVSHAGQTFSAPMIIAYVPLWARPILHLLPFRLDGVIGWPEVRNNILVFDDDQQIISRVDQLPPATAGWLKLKVVPADSLLLEVPLADGSKGVISLNIGLETGRTDLRMSAGPWREWQSAHGHGAGTNDAQIGPLALTGVTVKELPSREAADLFEANPGARAVWQLGTPALAHLDLVVDGINGWAYLHPKPAAQTSDQSAGGGNWQLADNVRLSADNLFVYAGWYQRCKPDVASAWADYNQALRLNPNNAAALSGCGLIHEIQGDFSNAVSCYDQVIHLRPDNSEWERLYRQTLLWRANGPPGTAAPIVPATSGPVIAAVKLDPVVVTVAQTAGNLPWPKTLQLFLDGSVDEKALLAAAKQRHGEHPVTAQKAQAEYFIGEAHLRQGDLPGAREWLKKCQSAGVKADSEYALAVAELGRLKPATHDR